MRISVGYAVCLLAQVVCAKKNLRAVVNNDLGVSSVESTKLSPSKIEKAKSFDFYVLSMSYQPEFCHMKRRFSYAGCEKPQDFWRSSLTIHGMWPENEDGSWPSNCSNEKFNPQTVDDLGEDRFYHFWPDVKLNPKHSLEYTFYEHEWEKHGTCTGLSQDDYFDTALRHFLQTPEVVHENYGSSIPKDTLLSAYRDENYDEVGDVVLVCSGGKYLSEVRICVAKSPDNSGSKRIKCIHEVEDEGSCGEVVNIAKFYVDEEEVVELKDK